MAGKKEVEDTALKVDDIEALPGFGEKTLKALKKAGITTIKDILLYSEAELMSITILGEKTTRKLLDRALEIEKSKFIEPKLIPRQKLTTGSMNLDEILGGGIETGSMTEFFGRFKSGKSQICHQLCVNVQLPIERGGFEGSALYIDTDRKYRPERMEEMARTLELDPIEAERKVHHIEAYTSDMLITEVLSSQESVREKNIKLMVIDPIIFKFRYETDEWIKDKEKKLKRLLNELLRMEYKFPDLAIVITNQMEYKSDIFYGNPYQPTGGSVLEHVPQHRIWLRVSGNRNRIAKIISSPCLPEMEALFAITTKGIRDETYEIY